MKNKEPILATGSVTPYLLPHTPANQGRLAAAGLAGNCSALSSPETGRAELYSAKSL